MTEMQSQLDKFKKAAREAECDTSEEKFDKVLKKVAEAPKPQKPERKKEQSENS